MSEEQIKNVVATKTTNPTSADAAKNTVESSAKPSFNRGQSNRGDFRKGGFGGSRGGQGGRFGKRNGGQRGGRNNRRKQNEETSEFDTQIIQVKRVTRVVKGGKRMRFAALVVVGNRKGKIGFGMKKGMDFQESVMKATRQAKGKMLDLKISENGSVEFPSIVNFKSTSIMMKPAPSGTGLISGGFVRPVLELAGVKNIYTKIIGSNNKISGVQAVFAALEQYKK